MAGARAAVHVVQLKRDEVLPSLIKGNKFIKWEDDSTVGTPVSLKVDSKGYILYWRDQYKEMDCLDISQIRDTRTGKFARSPKEGKLRDSCTMGAPDVLLEDKTISICYGVDMVGAQWINFTGNSKDVAKEWTDELLKFSYNMLTANASTLTFLEKIHTKLTLLVGQDGKVPIRNILKQFSQHRDERKKITKALEASGLPSGKGESINTNKFDMHHFLHFIRNLTGRTEVDKIFDEIGAKKKPYLTVMQLVKFLNEHQRDPRLNEILYPFVDKDKAQDIINRFETNKSMANKGQFSQEGFLRFLMSDENLIIPLEMVDLSHDMTQPLSHYFINSSHNTYLTGHQLTGRSSVEIYRQVLLSGCRCVELDCWDGKGNDEEPIITHGFTMCTEVLFKDVIEAIAESAFKTSPYPVILSFENHCSARQQAKMAQHCRNIFGDMLLTEALEAYPTKPGVLTPAPESLKYKILVKNKKQHGHKAPPSPNIGLPDSIGQVEKIPVAKTPSGHLNPEPEPQFPLPDQFPQDIDIDNENDSNSESDDSDVEDAADEEARRKKREKKLEKQKDEGTASKEAHAGAEMSALVNYVTPVHFHSFESSEKKNKSYEMSSFVETVAMQQLKEHPVEFVNYNKRQMSRIYPKGNRLDSSNFLPQVFWNAGCQLVALNFQSLDLAMQINMGFFEYNARCGYLLKPNYMRQTDKDFDPFAESTIDGIIAGTVSIQIISGQFLSDKHVSTCVEVDMFGLPADTVRRKHRSKIIPNNGINPLYNEKPFLFKKIVTPTLASLRIAVVDDQGKILGHRILPVQGLRPGYRHINLRNTCNQTLNGATLFVNIIVKDYVPEGLSSFADALSNPIQHVMELDKLAAKHEEQLAVLTDVYENEGSAIGDEGPADVELPTVPDLQHTDSTISAKSTGPASPSLVEVHRPSVRRALQSPLTKQESNASQGSVSSAGAAAQPPTNKKLSSQIDGVQSIAATTKLNDPCTCEVISLAKLKETKTYLKSQQKLLKDIESVRKKLDKAKMNMEESNEIKLDRLHMKHLKALNAHEKTQQKHVKKTSKNGKESDTEQTQFPGSISSMMDRQALQTRELRRRQMVSMVELCQEYCKSELEVHYRHQGPIYSTLKQIISEEEENQISYLLEICEQEATDLKKKLETQSRQEMKILTKNHKDKQELSRLKRESQQKHINYCVTEIKKLKEILQKKTEEVKESYKELNSALEAEKIQGKEDREKEHKNRCERIERDLRDAFEREADNAPNAPVIMKHSQSEPGTSTWTTEDTTNTVSSNNELNSMNAIPQSKTMDAIEQYAENPIIKNGNQNENDELNRNVPQTVDESTNRQNGTSANSPADMGKHITTISVIADGSSIINRTNGIASVNDGGDDEDTPL